MALAEHLEKLRHFQGLCAFKSINEGAKRMGISQAGLSKSISSLEEAIDVQLFVRSNEGLVLTTEGTLVLKTAEKILAEASVLESHLRSIRSPSSPKILRIGMYDSIAVYLFSSLREYLETIYKKVNLELRVDTSANLAEAARKGQVDIAIGVNLSRGKAPGSEFFLLFEDHYSFFVSSKIEGNLDHLPLLIHPRADDENSVTVEKHLESIIARRGAHLVYNFETLKALAQQGMGIGVLPTQVAKPLVQTKQLRSVQIPKFKQIFGKHEIGFLATKDLLAKHRDFAQDIYRLGQHWTRR